MPSLELAKAARIEATLHDLADRLTKLEARPLPLWMQQQASAALPVPLDPRGLLEDALSRSRRLEALATEPPDAVAQLAKLTADPEIGAAVRARLAQGRLA